MNYSWQREALKKVLCSTRTHPTAEWLYNELHRDFPNISIGTVYRNLAQLSDAGEILKLSVGSSSEHYDGFTEQHDHFVCTECGVILDIRMPLPEEVNESVEREISAEVKTHSLIFYGKCKNCKSAEGISAL